MARRPRRGPAALTGSGPAADSLPAGPVALRRWRDVDADSAVRAVAESLAHVAPWMAWAGPGHGPAQTRAFLAECEERWGIDFDYAIVAPDDAVAGSCSLAGRIGPGGYEIGYWVHPEHLRRGYATAATAALVAEALRIGADRVEIHHDVANVASGAIPRRLGFTEVERRPATRPSGPAEVGLDVIWRLRAPATSRGRRRPARPPPGA